MRIQKEITCESATYTVKGFYKFIDYYHCTIIHPNKNQASRTQVDMEPN